jgi:hypothetical protein
MKSNIFWDVVPCNLVEDHRRFAATYYFLLQGRNLRQANNQQYVDDSFCFLFVFCAGLLTWVTFQPWRGLQYVPPKLDELLPDYTESRPIVSAIVTSNAASFVNVWYSGFRPVSVWSCDHIDALKKTTILKLHLKLTLRYENRKVQHR